MLPDDVTNYMKTRTSSYNIVVWLSFLFACCRRFYTIRNTIPTENQDPSLCFTRLDMINILIHFYGSVCYNFIFPGVF